MPPPRTVLDSNPNIKDVLSVIVQRSIDESEGQPPVPQPQANPGSQTMLIPAGGFQFPPAAAPPPASPPPVPPIPPSSPSPPPQDVAQQVDNLWRATLSPAVSPLMTIKGEAASAGTITNLVIQPRDVRSAGDTFAQSADYELLDIIGEGGVGVVYAARQASINRTVALKMLRRDFADNDDHRQKFLSEAVVTGELDHPNIVPIYDLGAGSGGALFYSMKRVRGIPWSQVVEKKSLAENLEILLSVADAIAFAHDRGIIHRDLKPENVMLGDYGEVLVMDWGIALSTPGCVKHGSISQSTSLGGTPAYMSPEMATGPIQRIGPLSDVYLLGAILYEIVTGKPPHYGQDVMSCLYSAAANEIQPTDKSGELLDIALRALSTDPEDRHRSVLDFQVALRQYQSHSESIILSQRAEEELTRAAQTRDYQDYAKSLFGFEEALHLWHANSRADDGGQKARLGYAEAALGKGDFDLGLSLLSPGNPQHVTLRRKLEAAQSERSTRQRRLRSLRNTSVGLAVLVFVVVTGALISVYNSQLQTQESYREVKTAQTNLQKKNKDLETAKGELESKNGLLKTQTIELALREKEAEDQAARAKLAQQAEMRSGYLAQIGLASERIQSNSFLDAREILQGFTRGDNAYLRGFEWAHLRHLCHTDLAAEPVGARVEMLARSESGDLLAAATAAGEVRLWKVDWQQGKFVPLKALRPKVAPTALALSADGRFLATAGEAGNGVVELWQWDEQTSGFAPQRELRGHRQAVVSLAFSPAGDRLATSSRDATARLWDRASGTQLAAFRGHLDTVWSVAFGLDGSRLLTGGEDGTVRVWNTDPQSAQQQQPVILRGHLAAVRVVAFDPTGKWAASAGVGQEILVWDWSSDKYKDFDYKLVQKQLETTQTALVPLADGLYHHQPDFRLAGHTAEIRSLAFSRDGKRLASGGNDNTVRLWNLQAEATSPARMQVFRGHGGWVRTAAFSPDERLLISAAHDGLIKIWNPQNYHEVQMFRGHQDEVLSAAFSPAAQRVVTAGRDRRAIIWNLTTGQPLQELADDEEREGIFPEQNFVRTLREGHDFLVTSALFFPANPQRPEEDRVITTAGDNTARIWSLGSGGQVRRLKGTGTLGAIALSADGNWLLTGSGGQHALLWPTNSEEAPFRLEGHEHEISAVAIFPGAAEQPMLLFTGDVNGLGKLWRPAADGKTWVAYAELRGHAPGYGITAARFLPSSELLTACQDHRVLRWETSRGMEITTGQLKHPDAVTALDVSPDGTSALTFCPLGKSKYRLFHWNLATGKARELSPDVQGQFISALAFAPGGKSALVTSSKGDAGTIWSWDFSADALVPLWPGQTLRGTLWSAIATPDGSAVLALGGSQARLLDAQTGELLKSLRPHGAISHVAWSHAAGLIATAGLDGDVKLWDADEKSPTLGKVRRKISQAHRRGSVPFAVTSVAFSPEALPGPRLLLTAGDDLTARIWNLDQPQNQPHVTFTGHQKRVRRAVFSPNGKLVLTAADDNTARLWDAATGQPLGETEGLLPHPLGVLDAQFSPDGSRVITGCDDNLARVWDISDPRHPRELLLLEGHTAAINAVGFSPDGRRAVTASQDGVAKVWDVSQRGQIAADGPEKRREVLSLARHAAGITACEFSATGRSLLTASLDGAAIVWPAVNLAPAIRLPTEDAEFPAPQGTGDLLSQVEVFDPDSPALTGGKLLVETDAPNHRLAFAPAGPVRLSETQLLLKVGDQEQLIGTLENGAAGGQQLALKLADGIRCEEIQAVLRELTLAGPAVLAAPCELRITLSDGEAEDTERGDAPHQVVLKIRPAKKDDL